MSPGRRASRCGVVTTDYPKSHLIGVIAINDPPEFDGSTTFRVGKFRCTLSMAGGGMRAEWEPHLPVGQMTKAMFRQYRARRDAFLSEVSRHIGGGVLVVET